MSKNPEEPFDHSLESFFNQLINPFSEQENHMLAQMYLYNNPNSRPEDSRMPPSSSLMGDLIKNSAASKVEVNNNLKESEELRLQPKTGVLSGSFATQTYSKLEHNDNSPENDDSSSTKQKNRRCVVTHILNCRCNNKYRVNQNIASRNYRNRKKEYVTSLEGKVSQLVAENDILKKEIASLKRVDNFDSMRPDPAMISMVVELKHIMTCIDDAIKRNADDNSISYLLQLFHLIVEKRHHIFEKEVEKLVNPFAQAKLAMLGYAPVLEYPSVSCISGPNADGWWNQYNTEAQISRDQRQKLKQIREDLWKIGMCFIMFLLSQVNLHSDHDLRQERGQLDKSIKEFYLHKLRVIPNYPVFRPDQVQSPSMSSSLPSSSTIPDATPLPADNNNIDVSDIIELSRKLNTLKKNFCTTRNLMLNAFARLSQILSPRQQAMLLVRIRISLSCTIRSLII